MNDIEYNEREIIIVSEIILLIVNLQVEIKANSAI